MKDMYAKGSKGIKTKKMTMKKFEDSPEDKKADSAAMAKMNKSGKYADGTKGIKMTPKMSMDSDATNTAPVRLPAGKPAFTNYSKQLSTLSDNDVYKEVADNRLNMTNNSAKWNEAQDTINTRNTKKAVMAAERGYADGTKGISMKPQISADATAVKTTRMGPGVPKGVAAKEYSNAFNDYQNKSRSMAASTAKSDSLDQDFSDTYGNNAQYDRDFPGNKYSTGKSKLTKDSPSRVEASKIEKSKYAMGTKGIKTKKMY